jgi:hypothetical protein
MKKNYLFLALIIVSFSIFGETKAIVPVKKSPSEKVAKSKRKNTIKPTKYIGKVVLKSKKSHTYYALSEKSKTTLKLGGPGKMKIFLRVRLENNALKSRPYFISYTIDDKIKKTVKIESEDISSKMRYKTKIAGFPSNASTFSINVPPGKHVIYFHKNNTDQKIHASFSFKKEKQPEWIESKSLVVLDAVPIKYNEEKGQVKEYSRVTNIKKFTITAKEVTYLKILVKAELSNTVQSNDFVHLILEENNVPLKTFRITGKRSISTEYVNEKKLIPGNTNVIYFKIPKGFHTYNLYTKDLDKTALVQVYTAKNKVIIN